MALFDTLTKLPNRRMLDDRLGQAFAASKRSGLYGALMFLDLDNFKPLNDKWGHSVGDLLLVEVAHRLTRSVRGMDTVARFGGDEFIVLAGELDADLEEATKQAEVIARKIRDLIAEPYFLNPDKGGSAAAPIEHHCTSSIGAVIFMGNQASANDIIKWADRSMYQAKETGRNLIRFYDAKVE